MNKTAFFVFRGDPLCFMHVMLNALDMQTRNMDVKVILEGESVKLVQALIESGNKLFQQLIDKGLIDAVCKACSAKMGVLAYNQASGLPKADDLNGHPAMSAYLDKGYAIVTM